MHRLDFLPYHFLLTSVGEGGVLRYQVNANYYIPYDIPLNSYGIGPGIEPVEGGLREHGLKLRGAVCGEQCRSHSRISREGSQKR